MNKNIILTIAAHPDDEIIGCGGTIARLISEGHTAYTLILGEGITSRDNERDTKKRSNELNDLKKQVTLANKIIGVKDVFTYDFPDNRFDSVPLLDIVKVVENIKKKINPNIIFTHYEKDLNIDHQITYKAVITATRPMPEESVKEIYSFEVLSSTEWNYPSCFSPDVFFDISLTVDKKIDAIMEYKDELKDYPHPRSIDAIRVNGNMWGIKTGLHCAEAFKAVRILR